MPLELLEEIRVNLINELGRLLDAGYELSSPVVIQVAEVLDEVVDQIMEYEVRSHRMSDREVDDSDEASACDSYSQA